jgi:hypothetical protein
MPRRIGQRVRAAGRTRAELVRQCFQGFLLDAGDVREAQEFPQLGRADFNFNTNFQAGSVSCPVDDLQ